MRLPSFDSDKMRSIPTHTKHSSIVLFALVLLLFCWQPSFFHLSLNLAQLVLDNALWDEPQSALQRQESYALAARLFLLASGSHQDLSVSGVEGQPQSMMVSIAAAEYYRRQGRFEMVATMLQRAATARPYPRFQEAIKFPPFVNVMPDGSMVIAGSSPLWKVRADTIPAAEVTAGQNSEGLLSFVPVAGQNYRAAFEWSHPLDVRYYHHGILRTRVKIGCNLIFETVVDGKNDRHLTEVGTGEWEEYRFAFEGRDMRYIYILLGQLDDSTAGNDCRAEIDSLTFLLDKDL